jgi:hypothetical protein
VCLISNTARKPLYRHPAGPVETVPRRGGVSARVAIRLAGQPAATGFESGLNESLAIAKPQRNPEKKRKARSNASQLSLTVIARSLSDAAIWYIGVGIASSLALLAMTIPLN